MVHQILLQCVRQFNPHMDMSWGDVCVAGRAVGSGCGVQGWLVQEIERAIRRGSGRRGGGNVGCGKLGKWFVIRIDA